jgi:hypothetical protein
VDAAVNVFAHDCGDLFRDQEIQAAFIQHALDRDQRGRLREAEEERLAAVRKSDRLNEREKLEALSKALFLACAERKLPITSVGVASKRQTLLIDLPAITERPLLDATLRNSISEFSHYAILAQAIFGSLSLRYAVHAQTDSGILNVLLDGQLLQEYAEEKAGLLDLLHEAVVTLAGHAVSIKVDFDAVETAESQHLGQHFPRKRRP